MSRPWPIKIGEKNGDLVIIDKFYDKKLECRFVTVVCKCGTQWNRSLRLFLKYKSQKCIRCKKSIYSHNKKFFSKFTPISCYWAGFLAADGCISQDGSYIGFGLQIRDKQVLEQFKTDIEFTGPILDIKRTKSSKLQIYSAHELTYHLENSYNIVPNKSLILKPPFELQNQSLIKHFLIGIIDGDGCIKFCKRDKTLILDICGASEPFLNWIRFQLESIYDLPHKIFYRQKGTKCQTYRIQGKSARTVLFDLKSIAIRKLDRKWDKV